MSNFDYRGSVCSIKCFCSNYQDFKPNRWEILNYLGMNAIQLYPAWMHEFQVDNKEWENKLFNFLKDFKDRQIKVAWQNMGTWKNNEGGLFGLCVADGIEKSIEKINKLGGKNSCSYNFLQDSCISAWKIVDEPDLNAQISGVSVKDWIENVARAMHDKGCNYVGLGIGVGQNASELARKIQSSSKNLDCLSIHWYPTIKNPIESEWKDLQSVIKVCLENLGPIPKEKFSVIFGMKESCLAGEARGEWYKDSFQACKECDVSGVYPYLLFDVNDEGWGAFNKDGTEYPYVTAQYKSFYL